MVNKRDVQVTMRRLGAVEPWLVVERRGVRARDGNTGLLLPEHVFAVVLLWEAVETGVGAWIGWITTVHHRSACFCAADLDDAQFRGWLERLPAWDPALLTNAMETRGLHLVWRRDLP